MEKRILLAVVLSILVLLGYNVIVAKTYHLQAPATLSTAKEVPITPAKPLAPVPETKKGLEDSLPISLEEKKLDSDTFELHFTNLGGTLAEIYLKGWNKKLFETQLFDLQEVANKPFKLASSLKNKLVYVYEDAQKRISKIYSISKNTIELEVIVQNLSNAAQDFNFNLNYFSLNTQKDDSDFKKEKSFLEIAVALPEKIVRKSILKISAKTPALETGSFNWLALKDRYFCSIFKSEDKPLGYYMQLTDNKIVTLGTPISFSNLAPHASARFKAKLFAGPLEAQLLNSADSSFGQIINFGVFDSISKGLLSILRAIHKVVPNWGVCIIALSCLLFLLLYPLTLKSLKSMKAMQTLQPEMEKLRQQYKNDPQKLNKEIMELYRKNKVNPFGGCLPMILQIPVFIALYQALLRTLELRGAHFLWIKDLSAPDSLFSFPQELPFLGNSFNLLPILMAIIMFFQQKLSSKTTAATNPDQQKFMLIFFPILFGIMFYQLPSGLVLYWFIYSGLSLVFQWKQLAATQSS